MKILLVGEYNRSHYFLKEGLQKLGHTVLVVGLTDGFKKVDIDIEIKNKFENGWSKKLRVLMFKLFKIDLHSISIKKQITHLKSELSGYDVVQFINDSPFLCQPQTDKYIFNFIKKQNKSIFLLSCGIDYISVEYANNKKFRYSILTPFHENKNLEPHFKFILKKLNTTNLELHKFVFNNVHGVIASDLDYHIPLIGHKKYLGIVPNPINVEKIKYIHPVIDGKIKIFHGINTANYYKKGNDIFEKAIEILSLKYADKIEIKTVRNLPYKEYIKIFDESHILLDMVYAYDQGFNALEAMAKGKVVFTGAEKEWLEFYHLQEDTVAINALPDAYKIAEKLEWLINNPSKIMEISKNARAFVEREHDYMTSAKKYLEKWRTTLIN